jgi:acetylornithine deacetylase/succinyl-diaminopimelate desuccinylase-like protein
VILGVLLLLAAADPLALRAHVREATEKGRPAILREFADLLALPDTASDPASLRKNAEKIEEMLKKRGFSVRLLEEEGAPPAVFGELHVQGATKTLAIYAHYDGQPVDHREWKSPPFEPLLRNGPLEQGGTPVPLESATLGPDFRLYARGAGDDKAPIEGVVAALDVLKSLGRTPSVSLKVLFEGEEESGSPHIAALLEHQKALLAADCWLLCDGPVHQSRKPQVFFGARGVTDLDITVYGPIRPLHSGHYGNWAPNPVAELAALLVSLRDRDGKILIPAFYDDVRPLTDLEQKAVAALPSVDDALRESLALHKTEAGNALLQERILLPAMNFRGIESGARPAPNAIPTEASVSIDFRLVPDETPASVRARVEAFLASEGYTLVHDAPPDRATRLASDRIARLDWGRSGYPPARTRLDLPASRAVVAVLGAGSEPPLVVPSLGGSIPMYLFQEILKAPVIGLPIANHDDNQHAANENLRLQNLWDGIEAYCVLLSLIGPALAATR